MTEIPGTTPTGPDDEPLVQIVAGGIKPMPVTTQAGEWYDTNDYDFHPLSMWFPLMEGEEFENFTNDVGRTGQRETVKLYQGKILDGRNRYLACKARGIPCRYENWNGEGDPADYVISMNFHRRHLTAEARQKLVLELRKDGKSIRQIAERLQTSVGSVHRDIDQATVPNGTVAGELPSTIKGKDGKSRQARTPRGKGTKRGGKTKAQAPTPPVQDNDDPIGEGEPIGDNGISTKEDEENEEPTTQTPQEKPTFKVGDHIYIVTTSLHYSPSIKEWKISTIKKDGSFLCSDGEASKRTCFFPYQAETRQSAEQRWKTEIKELIADKIEEVKDLQDALQRGPKIKLMPESNTSTSDAESGK
jgi:hypothetical protein